jgi:hypothetical protein
MTISVDDEITVVEAFVVLLGIVITWVVYRRAAEGIREESSDRNRDGSTESPNDLPGREGPR